MTLRTTFLTLFLSLTTYLSAIEMVEGPVHEAFFMPVTDTVVYQAVAATPPDPILENVPEQTHAEAIWIPGYWAWDKMHKDFIWITGVWRKVPQGRHWISGAWKKFDAGWVWLNGFWSDVEELDLEYIAMAPPDSIEEDVGKGPSDEAFWASGYWKFDQDSHRYIWKRGSWALFDPEWVFVPGSYVWRPNGYVFIPPFWDYNLEERGTAYSAIALSPQERDRYIYEPKVTIDSEAILNHTFFWYPDFLYYFQYDFHFYPLRWINSDVAPPWWNWQAWWSFSWHDSWALWWWWSHPGYAHPLWMTASLAEKIAPPTKALLTKMIGLPTPIFVTPDGVVAVGDLIDAVQRIAPNVGGVPVLPADQKLVDKAALKITETMRKKMALLRPTGKVAPLLKNLQKPNIPDTLSRDELIEPAAIPPVPGLPSVLRPRPQTPGSEIKPYIRKSSFPTGRPQLRPPQESDIPRDLFRPSEPVRRIEYDTGPAYEREERPDRPPFTPTRKARQPRERREAPKERKPYEPPSYRPQQTGSPFPDDLYNAPTAMRKKPKRRGAR